MTISVLLAICGFLLVAVIAPGLCSLMRTRRVSRIQHRMPETHRLAHDIKAHHFR